MAIALPLLGLHYSEILTTLCRDEAIWRQAPTRGTHPDVMILLENLRFWPCGVMFTLKVLIPWIFSFAFACNAKVFMSLIPMVVFAFLYLLLAIFCSYLIARNPKGPQPPTYGNISLLAGLVDDWGHDVIYWGDKGEYDGGVRVCGTAGSPLPDLEPNIMYAGLRLGTVAPIGKTVDVCRGILV
jgi:hypothetical protein